VRIRRTRMGSSGGLMSAAAVLVSAPPACLASYRKKPRNSPVCCTREKIGATRRDTRDGESVDLYACRVVFSNAKRLGGVIGNCWRCVFSNFARNPRLLEILDARRSFECTPNKIRYVWVSS